MSTGGKPLSHFKRKKKNMMFCLYSDWIFHANAHFRIKYYVDEQITYNDYYRQGKCEVINKNVTKNGVPVV